MSRWHDAFIAQQPAQKVKEALRLLESSKSDGLGSNDMAAYARLLKALKVILTRFENLDPELYHQNTWANIGPWSLNLQNYATTFSQSPNPNALNNANSMADEILGVLRPGERQASDEIVKAVAEAAHSFQTKITEELEQIRNGVANEKAAVTSITESIDSEHTRLNGLSTLIEQQKGRLDQSIAAYQKQFSDAETGRSNTFASDSKKRFDDFELLLKTKEDEARKYQENQKQIFDRFFDALEKKSDDHLHRLQTRQKEVNQIFGAIGASSFAGHFKNTADIEHIAADRLRWIALASMGAMIAVAGITFYHSLRHDITAHIFAFRLATSVVILIPAIYAAQESGKHRDRENALRKMHLELASIDAYLVLLPEPQRNEIKAKMTEKFFGRDEPKDKEEPVSKHALFDLLSFAVKNSTKAK